MKNTEMNVRGVIKLFGGRAQLYRRLCEAKIEISHRTLDNWIYKGVIPMNRFIQLLDLAKASGIKLKLEDHLQSEPNQKHSTSTGSQPQPARVLERTNSEAREGVASSYLERLRG